MVPGAIVSFVYISRITYLGDGLVGDGRGVGRRGALHGRLLLLVLAAAALLLGLFRDLYLRMDS